ncbi:Asp-tRNA(Asn)/Glu-tRNA(Gln) amidotransferase subunit GatB [Candidatus Uhrbacteria bacterium]|jgi:aspartyl-tRNA(Asn)/glutamyl-tRNA(Gln) amidotransferase subunit B|nr:Asp-tRNA(Asn)/Glu-tRNA(Gln) amidotransferase subunit GatB [Candidatus Uhrbacteria bacterium]
MEYKHLETVIGLEIHVQLKTKTKLFSSVSNHADGAGANTLISAIDVGHPGTLPSLNAQALHFAVRIGLALNCKINSPTYFDRKHYIYPDLPKGYQISQFDVPVAEEGYLSFDVPDGKRDVAKIHIERAHLEEDAAKNVHRDGKTLVDFNRAGTPLVEIVTKPDFRTPQEAKLFLYELRRIMRYIGVSDADMEKGHMRCDANISLRPVDEDGVPTAQLFYPKTEVKNMNSFRSVERALIYEISRQRDLWETNSPPSVTTTRGWNEDKQKTEMQRTKEEAADYRFMREPDIPPTSLEEIVELEKNLLPELPVARRTRFVDQLGFKRDDTLVLTDDPVLADFAEATLSELYAWVSSLPDEGTAEETRTNKKDELVRLASSWIVNRLLGIMSSMSIDIRTIHITPENMAEFLTLVYQNKLNNKTGSTVLEKMLEDGNSPAQIMHDLGMNPIDDAGQLEMIINDVLMKFPEQVEEYKSGKVTLLGFFVGMVQKQTQGNADPRQTKELLEKLLGE